jgi:hypothetical protein
MARAIGVQRGVTARPSDPHAGYRDPSGPELVTLPAVRHAPELDADPRLVVLLPHLSVAKMSGGPNTALQITARLAGTMPLRYVATAGELDRDEAALRAHIRAVSGVALDEETARFSQASGRRATLEVGRHDVLFATWWPTAHLANAALEHVRAPAFLYLVQDFEPGFYAWSTKAALAEATYRMPIAAVINEPFLERYLREGRIGRFADPATPSVTFMPAVDRAVFRRGSEASPRRLLFYARPTNQRNLFELGLRALRLAAGSGAFDAEPWEFLAIGQELPDLVLSDRHVLRNQPWLSYQAYGALLGSADFMLALMLSPHTSYPPLEMATAGGRVVTNTFGPKTREALAAISPLIRGVEPDVASIVVALREAAVMPRPEAAPVNLPGDWDEALTDVVPWVRDRIAELRAG